jgi:hypothetical protein
MGERELNSGKELMSLKDDRAGCRDMGRAWNGQTVCCPPMLKNTKQWIMLTFVMALYISEKISSGTGLEKSTLWTSAPNVGCNSFTWMCLKTLSLSLVA